MEIIKPSKLVPGKSVIGVVAPSGIVQKNWLKKGLKILIDRGYLVKFGSHLLKRVEDWSAGTERQRLADFLAMVADQKVAAIFSAIGGFAATEILPIIGQKEIELIRQSPKILVGYSDVSLLLNIFASLGIVCFHGPNLAGLAGWGEKSQQFLFDLLEGKKELKIGPEYHWTMLKDGKTTGRLLVSNLDGLVATFGTNFDPLEALDGPLILCLEEIGEEKSRLIRWLDSLLTHRSFAKISGLILGRFVEIREKDYPRWGKNQGIEEIFFKKFSGSNLPLAVLADFGHMAERKIWQLVLPKEKQAFLTLPLGIRAEFLASESNCHLQLLEQAVA